MATALEPAPVETDSGSDDEITHWVCDAHNPDIAFCGQDVTGHKYLPGGIDCVVCMELFCPECDYA